MISDLFKLRALSAPYRCFEYSVSWEDRGGVTEHRWRLVEWAFKSASFRVAFSNTQGKVLDVDVSQFYDWDSHRVVDLVLRDLPNIVAVAFEKQEHALKFIDSAEKHIMWSKLKKKVTS